MPHHGPNNRRPGNARAQEGQLRLQEFDVTELTAALGCPRANALEVTQALTDLCRTAAIRFGVPAAAHGTIGSLLSASDKPSLLCRSTDVPSDPRWDRLAAAIIAPPPDGFPIATLRAPSSSALEVLKESVSSLADDLRRLQLRAINPATATALRDSFDMVRQRAAEAPEVASDYLNALRQLRLYHDVGADWARVTPIESFALTGFTLPEAPAHEAEAPRARVRTVERHDRENAPDAALLQRLGLLWRWSEDRAAWEPAPNNSRIVNATLFDLSSHYFEKRLAQGPELNRDTRALFTDLAEARQRYERDRGGDETEALRVLRRSQNEILRSLM